MLKLASVAAVATLVASEVALPTLHAPENIFAKVEEASASRRIPLTDQAAIDAVATKYISKVTQSKVAVTASYTTNNMNFVYLQAVVNGLPVMNNVANVNLDSAGAILSAGHVAAPAQDHQSIAPPRAKIGSKDAILTYAKAAGIKLADVLEEVRPTLAYYQQPSGSLVLTWHFDVPTEETWNDVVVDATTGELLGVTSWMSNYTYLAIPISENDIRVGSQSTMTNPEDEEASPNGWHNSQSGEVETRGNNVLAQKSGTYATSRKGGKFDYVYDPTKGPATGSNLDAAIVNTFYVSNAYHDILYKYGFTEASGNFQKDNFGRGGQGNDAITANVQASGNCNANFGTPPDGRAGRMNMYMCDRTTPTKDTDMDNGVIVHEITHGVSTRLTGGPSNSGCLRGGESGGMGEGWGDSISWVLVAKRSWDRTKDQYMGDYSFGGQGIRKYPYSTNMDTNPMTYSSIPEGSGVHYIGTIWSTMLYEVFWNMVEFGGFQEDYLKNSAQKTGAGNIHFLHLVLTGMKIQPCTPQFVDARDAILEADEQLYQGKYKCVIWKAFAKRGLGFGAVKGKYSDDFTVPSDCAGPQPTPAPSPTPVPSSAPASPAPSNYAVATDKAVGGLFNWPIATKSVSLEAAMAWCDGEADCAAFTYQGEPDSEGVKRVKFYKLTSTYTRAGYTAYTKQ